MGRLIFSALRRPVIPQLRRRRLPSRFLEVDSYSIHSGVIFQVVREVGGDKDRACVVPRYY